ncbi:MAG: Spermidine Putrescine transporter permease component potC [Oscillospiraceae bacterium]|nr:Spermidine Putrescine transporter permease component potC [Oscillospiraceae bacterium]
MDTKKLQKSEKAGFAPLSMLYACLVYLFLYLPIAVVIAFSFNTSKTNIIFEGFTFEWYAKMFDNRQLMESFQNTLIVAGVSTVFSLVLGTLCAVGLYKFEFKLKSLVSNSLYIPIAIPEIVFGIAMLVFFSSVHISTGMFTLIVSHITFSMPFVAITVRSRVAGFDRSIEEAAKDLGANEFRTFMRVTLPMIMPGVISGGMLALTMSLDDVVISFFTAGPDSTTLPLKILGMVKKGVSPDVNALSTLMILGTAVIMVISQIAQNRLEQRQGGNNSES